MMKKGFFIGRTTMDIVYYSHDIPAENEKSKTMEYMTTVGGNACNAAVTYALLGGKAVLITAIGDSAIGKSMKMELAKYQIEVIDLLEEQNILPFISAILINVEKESRTIWGGQQPPREYARIDMEEILKNAAFFLADNQFPLMTAELFRQAKEIKIPSVFDAERWGPETELLFDMATDVIASAECLSPDNRNIFDVMRERRIPYRAVTDGSDPIHWEEGEQGGTVLPMKVKPVDTLGAGDILHGAYCYFRFDRGNSFERSLERASQVSGFSVAYRGPRQGILEYLKRNKAAMDRDEILYQEDRLWADQS